MSSRDHSWGLWQEHLGSLLGGWHLSTQNWLLSARSVEKLFFTSHFLFSASEQLKLLHFYFSPDSIVANGLTLTCQAWWPVQITWSCHLTHQKSLTLLLTLYPFFGSSVSNYLLLNYLNILSSRYFAGTDEREASVCHNRRTRLFPPLIASYGQADKVGSRCEYSHIRGAGVHKVTW